MQRLFSSFPSGYAGAALLVLRAVTAALSISNAGYSLAISGGFTWHLTTFTAGALVLTSVALMLGFLTPIAAAFLGAVGAATLFGWPPLAPLLLCSKLAVGEFVVMALVQAVLGPGAFSLDARLFGRREISIGRAPPGVPPE